MSDRSVVLSEAAVPSDLTGGVRPNAGTHFANASTLDRRAFGKKLAGGIVAVVTAGPLMGMSAAWAQAAPPTQSAWRFCVKCCCLFFDGFGDKGKCAQGGGHDAVGFDFNLPHDAPGAGQNDWRYCEKCHAMFYDGASNKGRCPAAGGGGHTAQGFNFVLPHDAPTPGQNAWRFCAKCNAMFYDGYPVKGTCPGGGGHASQGFNFVLDFLPPPPLPQRLDFNIPSITFDHGVPVGGSSSLILRANGDFHLKCHFHDSGSPSYKVASAWMVRSPSGVAFSFAKRGSMGGTFSSDSRNFDSDQGGNNPQIQQEWGGLAVGARAQCASQVDIDLSGIVSAVKKVVEVGGKVVKVVEVLSAP